jgi:hypothetical protein
MNEKQRAVRILANLEGVKEDLLALMDDVGHSINYRDAASRQAANQFLDAYGQKLDDFERLAGEIADLIRGRQGIAAAEAPGSRSGTLVTPGEPAFRGRPHFLTEEFTFTRPMGFTLQGQSFRDTTSWADVYVTVCQQLARQQPNRFAALPDHPDFITVQNNWMFARDKRQIHNKPRLIADGIYAELTLSANAIRDRILKLLREFGIPEREVQIYLRREQAEDDVA